ncbi:guanine nucleotide-binding protein [Aspergillus avenaceus]|uniref:Guanine nucleotide-binding protein n=1 Tax=Aspergillus avenaceus TaxID=36643 RepID=A0A5N6TH43_ASPAV|nr:guanine nucleotide-binding protein [Aspergillus avenaceus]
MDLTEDTENKPICVASTQHKSKAEDTPEKDFEQGTSTPVKRKNGSSRDFNHVKSVEWTPDGTTLLTDSADHHIRTYILPPDLLEERPSPHQLSPYSILPSVEPTYATAIYPFYSLSDPSTTLFLSSVRDHPIRLTSALAPASLATYSLVNPTTEAFITPHSIIYPSVLGGTHFLTGSDSLICLFDVSRSGSDGPVTWMPTIPSKRKQTVGGGVGMKGIISAMAVNPTGDGVLAAGTFSRQIGLYDSNGAGQSLGTFSLAKTDANRHIGGRGITQLLWSPCGRYLYIAERKSDGVMIYDIRVTGQLLGWLEGRKANTNQRMKIDIVPINQGASHEIWAGGTDGFMRVWRDPTQTVGAQTPVWEWKVHDDSVSSTVLHPMGSVVATSSGQRHYEDESSATQGYDNSVKVWSMPFLGPSLEELAFPAT